MDSIPFLALSNNNYINQSLNNNTFNTISTLGLQNLQAAQNTITSTHNVTGFSNLNTVQANGQLATVVTGPAGNHTAVAGATAYTFPLEFNNSNNLSSLIQIQNSNGQGNSNSNNHNPHHRHTLNDHEMKRSGLLQNNNGLFNTSDENSPTRSDGQNDDVNLQLLERHIIISID